jgi:Uncharacterized protein conserved in bacteria (DUF2188)
MIKKPNQVWVSPNPKGWAVKPSGQEKPSKILPTKIQAMEFAKTLAKKNQAELIPQKLNGQIQNPSSFGRDPNPPKDKNK